MKWTPIDKAKPKFKQLYLLALEDGFNLGSLLSTTTTPTGLTHIFAAGNTEITNVTHIAAVSKPE